MSQITVLHENANSILVRVNGKEQWLPRTSLQHIINKEYIPDTVITNLSAPSSTPRRVYDLTLLQHELTLNEKINIKYKHNQAHQQAAFDKLHNLRAFALIMQMRAGKTKVAIDIICHHFINGTIERVLWLCPNSAIATTHAQWDKFAICNVPRQIVGLEMISNCGIKRYELIKKWASNKYAIIIDESQMIKNDRAKRSRRLEPILDKAVIKGILSGTPITRNIQDLYNQARALDWRILSYRNIWQFKRAHLIMSDKYKGLIRDVKNVKYLTTRLEPFCYEWFTDYSDRKRHQSIWVDMSAEQRDLYDAIKHEIMFRLSNWAERTEDIYILFAGLSSVLSGYVSNRLMRRIFGKRADAVILPTPKLDTLQQYVNSLNEQKIIWCTRLHELYSITNRLSNCITVSGEMSAEERHKRIQAFRCSTNGTLVAMVQVAKRSIEMSECNEVIYYGHSFDLESREQSQWRTLLPSKTHICQYTDLLYDNSLDGRILVAHNRKRSVISDFLKLLKYNRNQAINNLEKL